MKSLKIYLTIVSVLLVIAIGFGIFVWYKVQTLNQKISESGVTPNAAATPPDTGSSTRTVSEEAPITIKVDSLTPAQQSILKSFGYSQSTFTVTPETISCAKEAVGEKRFTEILNGSAPSPLEAMKLLPCFK